MTEGPSCVKPLEPRRASVPTTSVAMAPIRSTHASKLLLLKVEGLRDELAVVGRVAEGHLGRLGALEEQVHIVLPGEPDATVHLDAVSRDLAVRVRYIGLRHRGCE